MRARCGILMIGTLLLAIISADALNKQGKALTLMRAEYTSVQAQASERISRLEERVAAMDALQRKTAEKLRLIHSIIQCESSWRPRAINRGARIGEDVGLFQINTHYHKDTASAMGFDIYNPEDNIKYGLWLLETQGTRPWKASKHCWGPMVASSQ